MRFEPLTTVGIIAVLLAGLLAAEAQTLRLPGPRKVIVSALGEVTRNASYVGDKIRYRIYYENTSRGRANLRIVDRLDSHLTKIRPFHGGKYDKTGHAVVWSLNNLPPGNDGFVELEAIIGGGKVIRNQASVQVGGRLAELEDDSREKAAVMTNVVETRVHPQPPLGWVPFDRVAREGTKPSAALKEETTLGTVVRFDTPGLYAHEVKVGTVTFHRLAIPGHTTTLDIGRPELPIVGQLLEIPKEAGFSLEIVETRSRELGFYNVFPAQEPTNRTATGVPKPFTQDATNYRTDAVFPDELAVVEARDVGIIRGHRVVFLKVNPVRFNPVTRQVTGYSSIEVRLKFDRPAQIQRAPARVESVAFERLLRASVLNFKEPHRLMTVGSHSEEGVDYLILSDTTLYTATDPNDPLNRLAAWKRQKGLSTRIVDVANLPGGSSAASIVAYMQDAYQKWYPVPTYVLLVGDAELLPANYQTTHPNAHNGTQIGTDLHYATLDGTDYFPDLFLGRLSVDTAGELIDVVDKILDYEKSPPVNAAFYEDNQLVALFEDDTDRPGDASPEDGQEDATFRIVEFAEEIFAHLDGPDYDPQRIYDESAAATNPQRYENGTAIPAHLTAPGFAWNGATADITAALNNGSFLMTFNGHSDRDGWGRPAFGIPQVINLANGAQTPVVFSMGCQSGWFDNETDAADIDPAPGTQGTGFNNESFSEELLRNNAGGAVAVIGSSRDSWDPNDFMMLGLYKALWPAFDPAPPFGPGQLPDIETGGLYRIGQVHTFGKIYMANYYSHDVFREATFEIYHLFGDPEMGVWTDEPGRLDVDHPAGIGATGTQDFVVRVLDDPSGRPVRGATAVLTRRNDILRVVQTNSAGIARFTMSSPGPDHIALTVTARNYRPYEGRLTVTSGGADLNRLDPSNGPVGQVIRVGGRGFSGAETVQLTFDDQPPQSTTASGGQFGQVGDPDVTLSVPAAHALGPVNVVARGQTSNRFGVDVFQVRSANPVDLYLYDQWESSTWHLHAGDNPTWNNPDIQLYDSAGNAVESNNLTVGNTYTIKATIHNDTDFPANGVTVTFKWANFGLGQSDRDWQEIQIDTLDVPARSTREAEVRWVPPSTGHLCLQALIHHVEDINETNNRGQENTHVGPTSSPAKVSFWVGNPTKEAGYVHLELRQLRKAGPEQVPLWESWIRQPDPQLIAPGEKREAWVVIDPGKADIPVGAKAEFALTGSIHGEMIGGVNFTIIKK